MTHYDADTLTDYLHGELEPALDATVAAHLGACEPCTARYDAEARLGESLRAAARTQELELPAMVRARIWDAVRRERPSVWERLRGWGPSFAVPAAVAVALLAYLGLPVGHGGVATERAGGVSAAYYLDEHRAESLQNPLADHAVVVPVSNITSRAAVPTWDAAAASTLDGTGATN